MDNPFSWRKRFPEQYTERPAEAPTPKPLPGKPIPGWEPAPNSGMYGRRPESAPAAAIPELGAPPAGQRPAPSAAAAPAVREFTNNDAAKYSTNPAAMEPGKGGYISNNFTVMPKEAFIQSGYNDQAVGAALRAAAARGDWDAVTQHYANKGQSFNGAGPQGGMDQAALWRTFTNPDAMGRDKKLAGALLGQMVQQGGALDRQALANQADIYKTDAYSTAEGRKAALMGANNAAMMQMRGDTLDATMAQNLGQLTQTPGFMGYLGSQTPEYQSQFWQWLTQRYGAPAVKRADGGVIPPGNPMGTFGQPPAMQSLDPMVREYGQYVHTATQHGLQPVPFGKFIDLLAQSRAKLQQLPTQGMQYGFADGGAVEDEPQGSWWSRMWSGGRAEAPGSSQTTGATGTNDRAASMLGSGMAGQAANAIRSRQEQLSAVMREIKGYADGGAIPVAGREVRGPGTGRSDSIPAVIDGTRPAALSNGEFVFPADVVQSLGTQRLQAMIDKVRQSNGV